MGVKKLAPAEAYKAWIDLHPLTYTVSDKLKKDHTLVAPNLSKKTSIAAAVERYEGNPAITTSSWMLLDSNTILNKAKGGAKRACLYKDKQQMAVQLKVKRRTVDIEKIKRNEKQRYRDVMEVEIKGETQYLVCSSAEADVNINVKGGWTPVDGEVVLYHYEEAALPGGHKLLDEYLEWEVDDANHPINPVAKK